MRSPACRAMLLLAVLALACPRLHAQDKDEGPTFYLEHAYFLGYTYKPGTWHRVYARIVNRGTEDVEADVVLVVPSGATRKTRYVYRGVFPARSKRMIWFEVVPTDQEEFDIELIQLKDGKPAARATKYNTISRPLKKQARSAAAEKEEEAPQRPRQEKGKGKKGKQKAQAAQTDYGEETGSVPGGRFLVLKVDEDDVLPTSRQSLRHLGSVRDLGGVYAQMRNLPEKWVSMDGFDALMIGESLLNNYRPKQWNAIRRWIAGGGMLLVFPGNDWDAVVDSSLNRILPVKLIGQRMMNRLVLDGKYNSYDIALPKYHRMWEAEVLDGEVLYRDGEFPMVVRKRVGEGQIIFCAFPGVVLNNWDTEKREAFWGSFMRPDERVNYYRETQIEKRGGEILSRFAGAKVVGTRFVLLVLGIYFVAAAVLLAVFRVQGRMELAWALLLPLGIALGVLSYQTGKRYRRTLGNSITNMSVVTLRAGDSRGQIGSLFGVHTLQTRTLDIQAADHDSYVTSGPATEDVGGSISVDLVRTGRIYAIKDRKVNAGALPTFRLDAYYEDITDPLDAGLSLSSQGLTGTITNHTQYDLSNCLIVSNHYAAPIGDIDSGETREITVGSGDINNKNVYSARKVQKSLDRFRTSVVEMLFKPAGAMLIQPWRDRVFLVGWTNGTPVPVRLIGEGEEGQTSERKDFEKQSTSLMMIRLLPTLPESGSPVRITRQFFTLTAPLMGIFNLADTDVNFKFPGHGEMVVKAHPARWARDVEMKKITLRMNVDAWMHEIDLAVRDVRTGKFEPIGMLKRQSGPKELSIANAERYYDPKTGHIAIRIDSRIAPEAERNTDAEDFTATGWELRGFIVEADAVAK